MVMCRILPDSSSLKSSAVSQRLWLLPVLAKHLNYVRNQLGLTYRLCLTRLFQHCLSKVNEAAAKESSHFKMVSVGQNPGTKNNNEVRGTET